MLADTAVVEDRHLLTGTGIAPVRYPAGVLIAGKPRPGVRSVAKWFNRRLTAPAQRELRRNRKLLAEM